MSSSLSSLSSAASDSFALRNFVIFSSLTPFITEKYIIDIIQQFQREPFFIVSGSDDSNISAYRVDLATLSSDIIKCKNSDLESHQDDEDHDVMTLESANENSRVIKGHNSQIHCLAPCLFPYEGQIISGSNDRTLRRWNIKEAFETSSTTPSASSSSSLSSSASSSASSPSSTSSISFQVKQYDCKTAAPYSVVMASSSLVVGGYEDSVIRVFDAESAEIVRTMTKHTDAVMTLKMTSEGLLSGANDGIVQLWNVVTGECLAVYDSGETRVWEIAPLTSDVMILSASNSVLSYNTAERKATLIGQHSGSVSAARLLTPNLVVSSSYDNTISIWPLHDNKENGGKLQGREGQQNPPAPIVTLRDHSADVNDIVVLSPSFFVSSSDDCSVRIWRVFHDDRDVSCRCLTVLKLHGQSIIRVVTAITFA